MNLEGAVDGIVARASDAIRSRVDAAKNGVDHEAGQALAAIEEAARLASEGRPTKDYIFDADALLVGEARIEYPRELHYAQVILSGVHAGDMRPVAGTSLPPGRYRLVLVVQKVEAAT